MNGRREPVSADPTTPLLTVLRGDLGLVGAKEGCGSEQCYACAVLIDGRATPSCRLPIGHVGDAPITTVEGIGELQEFFIAEQAGQCGFCLAGMVVAAQGLLNTTRYPSDEQIREALDTNLCRCGIYDRIRRAIKFRIGQPEESKPWEVRPQPPMEAPPPARSPSIAANPELDSWLAVNADGTVTVFTGKAELGQGIATAVAQIAANELGVTVDRIRVVGPDTERSPDEGVTSGSFSIEHSGGAIGLAASVARHTLVALSAEALGATPDALRFDDGTVTDSRTGSSVTYWQLQGDRPFERSLLGETQPSGQPRREELDRIDLPAKVTGVASYVHDLRFPDMVHGRVIRPPAPGADLLAIDRASLEAMAGVVAVVEDGSFLAVVAEREEQALAAAEAGADLARWRTGAALPDAIDHLLRSPTTDYFVVDGTPDDRQPEPIGPLPISARYSKPLTMHASLGPSAAVAHLGDGTLTIWSATQGVFALRGAVAEALSMDPNDVRIVHTEGSGCYGHNGADDVSFDAALLAVACPGRPVKVVWTRADEHRWEPYSPAMVVELGARTDDEGSVEAFGSENWSATHSTRPLSTGDGSSGLLASWYRADARPRPTVGVVRRRHVDAHRNSDPLYCFESRRVQTHLVTETPIRTSAARGLGAYANIFALESFMDELALAAGADPVEYRLRHLRDRRASAVIEAAADAADWGRPRAGQATGRGIGFARYKNAQTYLAVVIEMAVSPVSGDISISRAVVAADAGAIVSPDGVSNQLEGGCTQAASWTISERVRVGSDRVESDSWETYPILRFSQSFPIATVLLDRPDQPSLGCGEAAQGPTAAAIANALYDATGARLRDLPLSPDRVRDAIGRLEAESARERD